MPHFGFDVAKIRRFPQTAKHSAIFLPNLDIFSIIFRTFAGMEKEMKFDRDILLRNILESQQRQIDSLENRINRLSQTILLIVGLALTALCLKSFL